MIFYFNVSMLTFSELQGLVFALVPLGGHRPPHPHHVGFRRSAQVILYTSIISDCAAWICLLHLISRQINHIFLIQTFSCFFFFQLFRIPRHFRDLRNQRTLVLLRKFLCFVCVVEMFVKRSYLLGWHLDFQINCYFCDC